MTKEIHYSLDLERSILGAILLEHTAFGRMYGILEADVFYYTYNQEFFKALKEMWERNELIDMVTVCYYLTKTKGIMELNGSNVPYFVTTLVRDVVSTAHLEKHALIARQMYIDREMIKLTTSGVMGEDGFSYINELQDKLTKLRQVRITNDFKPLDKVIADLFAHMEHVKDLAMVGVTTGFNKLDKITGGLEKGGMYIVAARPSVGKSAFMGQMVLGAANAGHKVGIISLEMEDKKIVARMASIVTDIEFWRINRNRMIDAQMSSQFYNLINKMSALPITISDTTSVSISDIKSKVSRMKSRNNIDVLFIDYLGLIDTDGNNRNSNREQEVSNISRGIKLMAMEYSIPVVLLCQLNRLSEQKGEKPKLHNLRESGSLEQDADGVLFIHRDFMSGKKVNEDGGSTESEADIIIAKWRNGELADLKLGFNGPKMKFYELDEMPKQQGNWKPVIEDTPF